jgi:hypothetical protein
MKLRAVSYCEELEQKQHKKPAGWAALLSHICVEKRDADVGHP